MIFVSFGNSPVPFPRLAEAVDKMALKLGEAVIVQSGYTLYPFKHCTCTSFFDQLTYKGCLKACSVAVLQGGWGGVCEASDMGCRIVSVPRKKGVEHFHDQEQLIRKLEAAGVLIGCYDTDFLIEKVLRAKTYHFKPIIHGNASGIINDFISRL